MTEEEEGEEGGGGQEKNPSSQFHSQRNTFEIMLPLHGQRCKRIMCPTFSMSVYTGSRFEGIHLLKKSCMKISLTGE